MRHKMFLVLLLLVVMAFTSGCGLVVVGDWNFMTYNGSWEQEYEFSGDEVTIEGANGNITVTVWDLPKVKVTANWSAKVDNYDFNPIIRKDEGSLSISSDRSDRDLGGTSYVVSVPRGITLNLSSSNGRVSVSGDALKSLVIDTSNGAVMVDNAGSGQLTIDTSNGLARISDWGGDISCTTSNGAITAILPELIAGKYILTTSNGGVSVTVDPDSQFQFFASTSNGSIRNSLPGGWTESPSGTNFSGEYNGGGAFINIRTSNSNIQLLPAN